MNIIIINIRTIYTLYLGMRLVVGLDNFFLRLPAHPTTVGMKPMTSMINYLQYFVYAVKFYYPLDSCFEYIIKTSHFLYIINCHKHTGFLFYFYTVQHASLKMWIFSHLSPLSLAYHLVYYFAYVFFSYFFLIFNSYKLCLLACYFFFEMGLLACY